MTHDFTAWLDTEAADTVQGWTRRKKLAVTVLQHPDTEDTDKNDAKKEAAECTLDHWKQFEYISPGMEMPFCSTGLSIHLSWSLKTPFFSRSDHEFDAFDNPISRDTLTGLPILKASGAKGMLGHIIRDEELENAGLADYLLGLKPDGMDEGGNAGHVIFGDVQFSGTASDIFSPHDRRFGVVDHPVGFEVVPAGASAEWGMTIPQLHESDWRNHLQVLFESIDDLLHGYGMSAKRSSGYGMADREIKVILRAGTRIVLPEEYKGTGGSDFNEPKPPDPDTPIRKSEMFDALVVFVDGVQQMKGIRGQALEHIVQYAFPPVNKKNMDKKELKKLGKKKKSFKATWGRRGKSERAWDNTSVFLEQSKESNSDEITKQQQAIEEWEKRKEEHEISRSVFYTFASISDLLTIIKQQMEVMP